MNIEGKNAEISHMLYLTKLICLHTEYNESAAIWCQLDLIHKTESFDRMNIEAK